MPRGQALLAGALTLAAGLATARSIAPRVPGGDEPHYLVITESLIHDGDLRIENNHRNGDYRSFHPKDLAPDFIQRGRDGEIYSIHAPGLSALVLPAFAIWGYRGAVGTLLLASAITGALVWIIGWRATRDPRAAWVAWAAAATGCTFLLQSAMVFPDGPGMLAVAGAVWLALRLFDPDDAVPGRTLAGVSILLAALPWLHTRFAVLAGGFGFLIVVALVRGTRPWRERAGRLMLFLAVPVASAVAWLALFKMIYGTFDPAAPYGTIGPGGRLAYVPGGLLGLLIDQQFGLIACAPALGAAFVGWFVRPERAGVRSVLIASGGIAVAYLAVTTSYWMWWAGVPATPARLAASMIPILALPIAVLWRSAGRMGRTALCGLIGASALITTCLIGVGRGALAWNDRAGQALWLAWLSPVVSLVRGWPSFFWRLSPEDLRTEWPFAIHAFVWVLAIAVVPWAMVVVTRSRTATVRSVSLALGVGVGLMAAVQAGWWLNHEDGLRPARSQLTMLGELARGRRVFQIGPFAAGRFDVGAGMVSIRPDPPGRTDDPLPWVARFDEVPAGRYQLELSTGRPQRGSLAIKVGIETDPLRTWPVLPLSRQGFEFRLTETSRSLLVEVDPELRAIGVTVRLEPEGVGGCSPQYLIAAPNHIPWNLRSPMSFSMLRKVVIRRQPICIPTLFVRLTVP
jgi:hypothetical protein